MGRNYSADIPDLMLIEHIMLYGRHLEKEGSYEIAMNLYLENFGKE
jgi:hypothetical protein